MPWLAAVSFVFLAPQVIAQTVFNPVATTQPDVAAFPPSGLERKRQYPPAFTSVQGAKQTNKFWANWAVENPREKAEEHFAIFVMPYALKWLPRGSSKAAELAISHNGQQLTYDWNGRIQQYYTPFVREFSLGAVEELGEHHEIVKETMFGVHIEVRGDAARKITYPIFQGMAYVSGRYEGALTPRVAADHITEVTRVSNGIWKMTNNRFAEFRVYALTASGDFTDASYDFNSNGVMNKPLDGWLRLAHVVHPSDAQILDAHAGSVVFGWEMDVQMDGTFKYNFEAQPGAKDPAKMIHFAFPHHLKLLSDSNTRTTARSNAPTKGTMTAISGNVWNMRVETAEASQLSWLPSGIMTEDRAVTIAAQAKADLDYWTEGERWKNELLFKKSYYWSGKGFQKVGTVCLILEEIGGDDAYTERCANILAEAFKCFYARTPDMDCRQAPSGSWYDEFWGGVAQYDGFYPGGPPCYELDFGNACYNDHHYHFGYFVVSGAILAKLRPDMKNNVKFVDWISTIIRDTANPSSEDTFFPRFRSFDWFDCHSWSRGVMPDINGKDQESTSEEVNLLYGLVLWGRVIGSDSLSSLGATMMSLETVSIKEYFLMKNDNPNHNPDFAKNHVTGIFFQNMVNYATWFGRNAEFIHGIQMLPLSPALQMTRDREFCQQEWDDVLKYVSNDVNYPWTSLIVTGGLAMFQPDVAYDLLLARSRRSLDDGLTKSFALYWTAKQEVFTVASTSVASNSWWAVVGTAVTATALLGCFVVSGRENKLASPDVELADGFAQGS